MMIVFGGVSLQITDMIQIDGESGSELHMIRGQILHIATFIKTTDVSTRWIFKLLDPSDPDNYENLKFIYGIRSVVPVYALTNNMNTVFYQSHCVIFRYSEDSVLKSEKTEFIRDRIITIIDNDYIIDTDYEDTVVLAQQLYDGNDGIQVYPGLYNEYGTLIDIIDNKPSGFWNKLTKWVFR